MLLYRHSVSDYCPSQYDVTTYVIQNDSWGTSLSLRRPLSIARSPLPIDVYIPTYNLLKRQRIRDVAH